MKHRQNVVERSTPSSRRRTSMNIDHAKLARARRILATRTDTEAVDMALELVIANAEIGAAIDSLFGSLPAFKVS